MAMVNQPGKPDPAPSSPAPASRRRRRRWPWAAGLVAILLIGWYRAPIMGYAVTGASFGARVACSCRHVSGRSLEACRKDFEPGMGLVSLSEDTKAKSVTARFLLLSSQTATWHEGEGCALEKWDS